VCDMTLAENNRSTFQRLDYQSVWLYGTVISM
jgi:hypothetical protein